MRKPTIATILASTLLLTSFLAPQGDRLLAADSLVDAAGQCPPIVFIKRHHFREPFGLGTLLCWNVFTPGGGIYQFDPTQPEREARPIFQREDGVVFDMDLSFDARRIVFSWMSLAADKSDESDSFHVYEINVDGSGLRQLTDGPYHDVHPIYLPGDRIGFVSTRVESYQMCQPGPSCALYDMQSDGADIRRQEFGTLGDYSPCLLDDGRILFTRWEYQDKSIFTLQSLWTINPNGSRVSLFYGNTITTPNVLWQARPIPGTEQFVCTAAPHHKNPVGAIVLLDRQYGLESPRGVRNITPEVDYQPTLDPDWRPGDVPYRWSYRDPFPVGPGVFLVSYGGPAPQQGGPGRYRLFLLDDQGNKAPLYEDETISCFYPMPAVPRNLAHQLPSPPRTADNAAEPTGKFYVLDVYQGLTGVARGEVDRIRVMSTVPKRCNMRGQRAYDHDPLVGRGTYYVKELLGEAMVEEDGSAYFHAPAGRELYFQAIDADGKELCRMGSVTQLMPGETQGCVGCHESRASAPPVRPAVAMTRPAESLQAPSWGLGTVDFVRHVQPTLDRYCVECHAGEEPDGEIDLSGDKTRFFNMAYDTLTERRLVEYYWLLEGPTGVFLPKSSGSYVSRLTELIESGHDSQVDMDADSRRRIYAWIDANVPYYGSYQHTRPGTSGSRDAWAGEWFGPLEAIGKRRGFDPIAHTDINLTHPEHSRVLRSISDRDSHDYLAALAAIQGGAAALTATPRIDMPNANPPPFPTRYGGLFYGFAGP